MMFDSKDAGMGTQTINPAEHRLRSPGLCRHREPIVKKVLRLWEQIRLSIEPGNDWTDSKNKQTEIWVWSWNYSFSREAEFPFHILKHFCFENYKFPNKFFHVCNLIHTVFKNLAHHMSAWLRAFVWVSDAAAATPLPSLYPPPSVWNVLGWD